MDLSFKEDTDVNVRVYYIQEIIKEFPSEIKDKGTSPAAPYLFDKNDHGEGITIEETKISTLSC